MNYFEQTLDSKQFIRVHRSYIMNLNELAKIESFEKIAISQYCDLEPEFQSAGQRTLR